MVFLRDGKWPAGRMRRWRPRTGVRRPRVRTRATCARPAKRRAARARRAVQAFDRIGEAVTASASRQAGQDGATRVTRRRAALRWLPSRVWSFFIGTG
ncbi:hypothetical protein AS149_04710 [Burkholderia cenocepacia]|nr:hypothetical protein AS149_04710 [Burkholderia cenocepacia]